ncbi:hypothetical protein I5M32_04455 [Pedobacter sp. SD-b]|uniref:Uncharacterized protein n=1 Tax=Pedobacter segetis TaxID=2793069 RepID=A0ABS1BH51_9SPHI|nr:hypothetical protein [Pedobacter segetis]MBK0382204.1 hypothetical protein [Pedobacter segetis]
MFYLKRCCFLFIVLALFSCKNKSSNLLGDKIKVAINLDSTALVFSNIDEYILKDLSADSLADSVWAQTIAVYPKATNDDLQDLQKSIKGKYSIIDSNIVFTPDSSFKKGKTYLVELYLQKPSGDIAENIKSNSSLFNNNTIQKTIQF